MRIGEVNKDNYGQYLQMLGLKNSKDIEKSIDNMWGKDKEDEFDHSIESAEKWIVAMGWGEEGMLIDGNTNDGSWKKNVPVSDEIKDKLINALRRQFLENGNGLMTTEDGDEIGSIFKEYRKNISPGERLSVTWTLNNIVIQEGQRLMNYVKSNMPSDWKPGEPIDTDVLARAVSGEHFDTKA